MTDRLTYSEENERKTTTESRREMGGGGGETQIDLRGDGRETDD